VRRVEAAARLDAVPAHGSAARRLRRQQAEEAVVPRRYRCGSRCAFRNRQPCDGSRRAAVPALDGLSLDAAEPTASTAKHTIAGELLPGRLELNGVPFTLGSSAAGAKNVLVPNGQVLQVPQGSYNRVYVLAAAVGGDVATTFTVGAAARTVTVREWQGPVGQWWSRLRDNAPALREPFVPGGGRSNPSQQEIQAGLVVEWDPRTGSVKGIDQIRPAFVKRDEIAWIGTHRHDPAGNEIAVPSYVFAYGLDLPAGTKEIRLPVNDKVRILAVSVANEGPRATPAGALYMAEYPDRLVVPPPPAKR
jgi:hypothetical protein